MTYRIEFVDDPMTVMDADGNGHDACVVDPRQPREAVNTLAHWAIPYKLDVFQALLKLRAYLRACATNN
ncbi:MAG: hypothetical protein L0Z07_10420 [Planctomycetes bacterium]|nr:hypothetical protein [Planctomycetota bacterium]